MKRRALWAFAIGFFGPILLTAGLLYLTSSGFAMLDPETLTQCLLIIGAVSLLIALFTSVSSLVQETSPEQEDFRLEISREAGALLRALFFLRKPAFLPFWLAMATLLFGLLLIFHGYPMPGSLTVLVGQAFWFLIRGRLRHFIDTTSMDNRLYPHLLWTLRIAGAIFFLSAIGPFEALERYGEIIDSSLLLGAAAFISAAYVITRAKKSKEPIDMDHALKATVGFIWVAMAIAVANFAFDFSTPLNTKQLNYRKCLDHQELVLKGRAPPAEEMLDCHYFSRVADPQGDSTIEFEVHGGALGIRWKKNRLLASKEDAAP